MLFFLGSLTLYLMLKLTKAVASSVNTVEQRLTKLEEKVSELENLNERVR
jgi:hypothetical protein